ncbi:cilia- and flagella-associated protein 68 isoform X1 [Mus musculus]|uniref:cilia- and flagella-associated protein 68 isoform X1 n=1 Tax=Mus musculus TaxID=10090 RepID=UPI0003D7681C|nr:uncharacterized protein CFAP68 isoform X1 [Mus musculus]|eukprot:XP_006510641.1 PREDICTED: UPF0686 protein C11orf1 homolog isoform X1 [Mus musculus]
MELPYRNRFYSLRCSSKSLYSPSSYTSIIQRQNLVCYLRNPHYGSLIYADGHGEVWTDWNDMSKFLQYGWRCTTNENSYSNRTLFGHAFETTYDANYSRKKPQSTHRFKREPHWFPGHQPELDPPHYKCTAKSTYMTNYSEPQPTHYSCCVYDPSVSQS